jgi:ankyrin repeat protein
MLAVHPVEPPKVKLLRSLDNKIFGVRAFQKLLTLFMIKPEILHWIVPYLEMDDISHLVQTCREFSESLTDLREIIKATKNNSIYERAELLQIVYEKYSNHVIDWEELKPELKGYNKMSNAVILLNDSRVDPSNEDNQAIINASIQGHFEIVQLLLQDPRVDPSANEAIQIASEYGYFEIVRSLLQESRVDPSDQNNIAIQRAIQNGNSEVVRILLEDSRVNSNDQPNDWEEEDVVFNEIVHASECGYFEIVRLLLEDGRVDPSDYNNAVVIAIENGHIEMAQLLVIDQRVRDSTLNVEKQLA